MSAPGTTPTRTRRSLNWLTRHWFPILMVMIALAVLVVWLFVWHPWKTTTAPAPVVPATSTTAVTVPGIDTLTEAVKGNTKATSENTTATIDNTAATKENTTTLKSNTDKVIATAPAAPAPAPAPTVVYVPIHVSAPTPVVTEWVTEHELDLTPNKGHRMYQVRYNNGRRTEEIRYFTPERYITLEGDITTPTSTVVYVPTPAPAPAPTGNDCQEWTKNTNGSMSWVGPTDGTMSICQTGTWLDWIRAGHTAVFSVSVPGTLEITTGSYSTQVTGNVITYTVINSSGPSGGFRWTPQQGYGWRR
ncbi:MAG: hypothetical protein Q8P53_00885 [Candidatus Shapirobacteria bacterium]|nr:hypothetical protein [Candidatus Shapirobacteria bacterium]